MEKVITEYRQLAANYDQRFFHYNAKTIDATARHITDINGKRLIDIGCGTGIFLALLNKHYPDAQLCGVDIVDSMLHIARDKLPASVELIEASACHLPIADNSADIITSSSAFHYFPQQDIALAEMMRVLKPGGKLIITDWCYDFFSNKLLDRYLRILGKGHYQMLTANSLKYLLQQQGATVIQLQRFKINWLWGMMTAVATKPHTNN